MTLCDWCSKEVDSYYGLIWKSSMDYSPKVHDTCSLICMALLLNYNLNIVVSDYQGINIPPMKNKNNKRMP